MRATAHRSSRTGRQIPDVVRAGPQSQPKLQAILRMALNGGSRTGAGHRARREPSAAGTGAVNVTTSSLTPSRRWEATSNR